MINIQNALNFASRFLGSDKINKAIELSKSVKTPQDAIKVLSSLGDPDKIINSGLSKLNNPMARQVANMCGVSDSELNELKNEIMGIKNPTQKPIQNSEQESRFNNLLNGLK